MADIARSLHERDTIDPTAWSALMLASLGYEEQPGRFLIERHSVANEWDVMIVTPEGWMYSGSDADINEAIRRAIAAMPPKAENRTTA